MASVRSLQHGFLILNQHFRTYPFHLCKSLFDDFCMQCGVVKKSGYRCLKKFPASIFSYECYGSFSYFFFFFVVCKAGRMNQAKAFQHLAFPFGETQGDVTAHAMSCHDAFIDMFRFQHIPNGICIFLQP